MRFSWVVMLVVAGCARGTLEVEGPEELVFDPTPVGSMSTQTVTLRNTGAATMEVTLSHDGLPFHLQDSRLSLEPGASQTITVVFSPLDEGVVVRSLRFDSNGQRVVKTLRGSTPVPPMPERFEPCDFELPQTVTVFGESTVLSLRHRGQARCVVNAIRLELVQPSFATLTVEPLPRILANTEVLTVTITAQLRFDGPAGELIIESADREPQRVAIDFENAECIAVTLPLAELQAVVGCSTKPKTLSAYDTCSDRHPGLSVRLGDASSSAFQLGDFVTELNGRSLTVPVTFAPTEVGEHRGVLEFTRADGSLGRTTLIGTALPVEMSVDTYRSDPPSRNDTVFVVDASPSFVERRASIRVALERLLRAARCTRSRVAFMAADPTLPAQLVVSDAGLSWVDLEDPSYVDLALRGFDAVPVGSETETFIARAADVLPDAGVRADAGLVGVFLTDALDQSPAPDASLAALKARFPGFMWTGAFANASSTCSVESIDDGTLARLGGQDALDICTPETWWHFGSFGNECGWKQRTFFLNELPRDGVVSSVLVNQVPATGWRFDRAQNVVIFDEGIDLAGALITISYPRSCPQ